MSTIGIIIYIYIFMGWDGMGWGNHTCDYPKNKGFAARGNFLKRVNDMSGLCI